MHHLLSGASSEPVLLPPKFECLLAACHYARDDVPNVPDVDGPLVLDLALAVIGAPIIAPAASIFQPKPAGLACRARRVESYPRRHVQGGDGAVRTRREARQGNGRRARHWARAWMPQLAGGANVAGQRHAGNWYFLSLARKAGRVAADEGR
jgi:hypothetical protein